MVKLLTAALVLTTGILVATGAFSTSAAGKEKLFSLVGEPRAVAEAEKSSIASVREAEITIALDATGLDLQPSILLELFDGKVYEAELAYTEERSAKDITWMGKIRYGAVDGEVIITHRNGFVSALIYGPTSVYEIVPRGNKHILVELDQNLFPQCGGAIATPDESSKTPTAREAIVGVDSGDRIDVIVVYTTATKNFLGGDQQAQALAQSAIDTTNTTYVNSMIRQRVRMVHTQEFVYTESGNSSTDLTNLRNSPIIQALRDTHKADLVAEISEVTGVCGIGHLMNAQGGVPNQAFTVTARSCAVGNLSFPHELGHNMGAHHNPENAGTPIFPYGFGHYINGNYRTVMSYVDPCASGCTRRPYFSNPLVIFNGFPTGLVGTRDNARMLNTTADWSANYRYSGSSVTMTNFTAAGDWLPRRITRNVTWTSDALTGNVKIELSRDEGTTWETLVASTPNDGSHLISVGGPATRRARLRIVSLDNTAVSDSSVVNVSIR